MTNQINQFFSQEGPLSSLLDAYSPRPAQITMANAIADTLEDKNGRLMVEAGTGTGKSLAYLIAALLSGKKVLISTATKTLQDQLFHKDLPLALKALGQDKNTLLMKGRGNYLCLLKAEQFSPTGDLVDKRENKRIDSLRTWIKTTETGDRAELTDLPDDSPWWSDLNATSESCLGQACAFYSDCYVTRMRRKAQGADVLVVNHSLLCADQKNDDSFGKILPKTDLWILDEAHALEDVATRSFGMEVSGRQLRYLTRDLRAASHQISGLDQTQYQDATDALLTLFLKICEFFGTPQSSEFIEELKPKLAFLEIALSSVKLELLARRVYKITTELNFMLSEQSKKSGFVIFVDRDNRGQVLSAAPIEPAEVLKNTLWKTENPIILTSATLAVGKSLESFQKRIGLEAENMILEAPFDSLAQSALYTPAKPQAIEDELRFLVSLSQGGTFLLFTSYRAMNSAYENLREHFESQGLQVLKQGDAPKLELIRNFIEADSGFGAVLFATHSFWEGVDVQGKALRMVVIDKLPFKSPEEPIHKARCQSIEQTGTSSFYALSVPQAALTLKQGVGRLLRTHEDRGVVAILDPRIIQKSYGKIFLDTLPPMTHIYHPEKLREFWKQI
ncbi:MAG: ATP-dependent DNA helicase [Myxococcaceae bacterium]